MCCALRNARNFAPWRSSHYIAWPACISPRYHARSNIPSLNSKKELPTRYLDQHMQSMHVSCAHDVLASKKGIGHKRERSACMLDHDIGSEALFCYLERECWIRHGISVKRMQAMQCELRVMRAVVRERYLPSGNPMHSVISEILSWKHFGDFGWENLGQTEFESCMVSRLLPSALGCRLADTFLVPQHA